MSAEDIKDLRITDREIQKRISGVEDRNRQAFKEASDKQAAVLEKLNNVLPPIGIMGTQVKNNEKAINRAEVETKAKFIELNKALSSDITELAGIINKWEARLWKIVIGAILFIIGQVILIVISRRG